MKAIELAQNIKAETDAQFPDGYNAEVFASKYFNSGVLIEQPDGTTVGLSPSEAATLFGAARISEVITEELGIRNSIVLLPAHGLGGGFSEYQPVPFLQFAAKDDRDSGPYTGPVINAGFLLGCFNHGVPAEQALASVAREIAGDGVGL